MKPNHILSLRRKPVTISFCTIFTFTLLNSCSTAPSGPAEGLVLNYELGKTYTYIYETNSVIKLLGTSDEQSEVQLKGEVILTPLKKNDFVLTLGDFVLDVTSPNEKLASPVAALKGSTSRFITEGGIIQTFYVKGDESAWVANFHRAIVSSFNNYALKDNQKAFYLESDISGKNCPTEYKITSDGSYTKRRDLNKCLNRDGGYTEQYGVPFTAGRYASDESSSDTSIRSSQECIQKYANGILSVTECSEIHRVTLLASGKDEGGNARITSKIQFQKAIGGPAPGSVPSKLSTILFDHAGTDLKQPTDSAEILEALIGKLCLSTGTNGRLSSDTASVFLTLKAKIRFASKQVLQTVFDKLKSGKICEAKDSQLQNLVKLYVDAVLMAGSTDSIAFGAQLIESGVVSKNSQKIFRLYTAFANQPGEAALQSMLTLLNSANSGALDSKYLLTASGIAYQYCLAGKEHCASCKTYGSVVNKIAELTKGYCAASVGGDAKSLESAVIGLQALGNINNLVPSAVETINSCLRAEQSDRIKIHALQAIRRDPCQDSVRTLARNILKTPQHPAHVRISAYLALSQCYSTEDSDTIRSFIQTEESIQVLSYLKSHRENAWAKHEDQKLWDNGLFKDVNFEKLENDPRKFSASTTFSDEADFSNNFIYSDDSFLPKIVYTNSSAKLFGQEFGLIEVGAHLGGMEQDLMELAFQEDPTKFQEKSRRRPRRQANGPTMNQNEIDVFHSKVRIPERKTVPTDVYFRIFGTTVYASSFSAKDLVRKASRDAFFGKLIEQAMKGEEVAFSEAYPLYGDELIIPTVSGLSLWIHNEGAAIVSLKYSHTNTENFVTFSPKFSPGISVANNMKMSIAGDIIEAGLRAETTAAASTDITLTGTFSATDERYGYEIRVAMPPGDVKLIDVSNELYWVLQTRHSDYDQKQKMKTKTAVAVDTGLLCTKYLPIVTGIKACFQATLPPFSGRDVPHFPLSGPAKISLTMSPPPGARELVVKFTVSNPQEGGIIRPFVAEIDAPGSTENVHSVFKASLTTENGFEKFSFDLESPRMKAGFSSLKAVSVPGVNDLSYTAYVNDKEYKLHFKNQFADDATAGVHRKSYEIRYTLPKQAEVSIVSLDLTEALEGSNKIFRQVAFKLNQVSADPQEVKELVSLSLSMEGTLGEVIGRILSISTRLAVREKQIFQIKSTGKRLSQNSMLVNVDAVVLNFEGEDENLNINGEVSGLEAPSAFKKLGFKGTLKSTSRPALNGNVELTVNKPEDNLMQTVINIKSPKLEVKVSQTVDKRNGNFKMSYDGRAICSELKINKEKTYEIELTAEKVLANFRYASDGQTVADIKFALNKPSKTYDGEITVILSGKKYALKSKNSDAGGRLVFEHSAQVEGKFTGSVKTEIFDSRDGEGVWKNRETTLTSDAFPDPYTLKIKYNLENSASIKVSRASTDIGAFSVSSKTTQDGTQNFMLDISAENVFVTSIGVKCNVKEGRVELLGSATAPPQKGPQRVVKLVVTGKSPDDQPGERKFGVLFDLKLDGEKDPNNAFSVVNNNRWNKSPGTFSLESDNTIRVKGNNRVANFKLTGQAKQIKVLALTVDHTSPEGKQDKLELSTELDLQESKKFVSIKFEGLGEGGTLQFGIQNVNAQQNTGEFIAKFTCAKNGVLFDILGSSSLKDGGVRAFGVSVGGFGFLLTNRIQNDLAVETGPGKHKVNFLGNFGSNPVYLNINFEKTKGTTLKKLIFDLDFDRNYQKANGAALTTKTTFAHRYNSITDFEVHSTGQYDLKGDNNFAHSFSRSIKANPGSLNIDFGSKLKSGDNAPESSEFKLNLENSDKRIVVVVDLEHQLLRSFNPTVAPRLDFDLQTTKDINDLQFSLSTKLPSERVQSGSLNIRRTVSADETTRVAKISGKLNQEQVEIETNVFLTQAKKTSEVSVKLNNDPPKKLSIKYDNAGGHVAEATYTWGDNGQVLKSKGSVTSGANDGFSATFEFDVPAMNQQWKLDVSREVTDQKTGFSFQAVSSSSKQHIKIQLGQDKSQKISYSGLLSLDLAAPNDKYDFEGTVKAVVDLKKSLSLKIDYVAGEDKRSGSLAIDSAISPSEKQFEGKVCLAADNCFTLKSSLQTTEVENKAEFSLTNPNLGLEASASGGLSISADRKTRLTSFKYSLAHSSFKVKKELGINLYKKPGSADDLELTKSAVSTQPSKVTTRGIEVILPERTYGAHIAYAEWNDLDANAAELSLWFDKKASPNQKLSIGYSNARASIQEEGQGKDITFTVRHHKLQRDLRLKTKYRYGITSKVFEYQTEIDIFKRPEDKLVYTIELSHDVASETYGLNVGLVSEGQQISLLSKCDGISVDFPEFAATCTSTRKVSGVKDSTYKIQVKASDIEESVQIYDGENRVFYYNTVLNRVEGSNSAGVKPVLQSMSVVSQLQLPGMTDLRNFNARWSRSPFRFTLSTNPSSRKDTTNFWIGATSFQGGGWGLYRTDENVNQKDLADFSANVKAKKLHIDFDWNKENIASYLDYIVKRGQEIEQQATKTCSDWNNQEWILRKAFRKSFRAASQDFEPILQWYETQLTQIGAKYGLQPVKFPRGSLLKDEDEPRKSGFVSALNSINECLKSSATSINNLLNSVSNRQSLPTPEAVKERSRKVREFAEELANKIRGVLGQTKVWKEKYPILKKYGTKLREKVVAKIQSIIEATSDDLNGLYPYPEVSHFLDHFDDYFEVALLQPEKISQENKTEMLGDLEKAVEKILSKTYSFNFNQGKIRAKIPLLSKLELFQRKHDGFQNIVKVESECLKELLAEPSNIMPPVNATALIIGTSNYATFDGTIGSFDSNCQYLMASDFVNKNLSVVLDLSLSRDSNGVGSTLFVTDQKTTVGIQRGVTGSNVVANGKVISGYESAPVRVGPFVIYQEASFTIIEGDMGITVGCTDAFALCAVQVSGFYHGKLQGVFGKYNNEPSDDWTLPDGQVTTNDANFQKRWRLNDKCSRNDREDTQLPLLQAALKRKNLKFNNFFTRSSSSPHLSLNSYL